MSDSEDIERTQPGLIDKLASRGCTMLFERKEQVGGFAALLRQGNVVFVS